MFASAPLTIQMNRRARLTFRAAVLGMVLCLALAAMDAVQVWNARDRDMRAAGRETANLVEAVASQVQDTFDVAAAILVGVAYQVAASDGTPEALASLDRLMAAQVANGRPHLRSLAVLDPDGLLIADSSPFEAGQRHYGDRAYFRYHR